MGKDVVEVEARIIANVDLKSRGEDIDVERLNFREDLIEALKKVPTVSSALIIILDADGEVLARAGYARDPEPRRG
jgi:hypothetical protein